MKRYAGDYMTAYVGFILFVFTIGPIVLSFLLLAQGVGLREILFSGMLVCLSCLCGYWMVHRSEMLYSWYEFREEGVVVKNLFKKSYLVLYSQCSTVGIGYYIHGILNSNVGSKLYYIYLSNQLIDEKYRHHMNLLNPSKNCLKIGYNRKTYEYLLQHLSESQSISLKADAKKLSLVK